MDGCSLQFQLDANMGMAAAMMEVLAWTPAPGVISLFPSLPSAGLEGGEVRGIVLRGAVTMTMRWHGGKIVVARLAFADSCHPWLRLAEDDHQTGFYHLAAHCERKVLIHNAHPLRLMPTDKACASLRSVDRIDSAKAWETERGAVAHLLELRGAACEVVLCGEQAHCLEGLAEMDSFAASLAV